MFKINPAPSFWASVPLTVPGQAKQETIEIEFKHLSKPALKGYFEGLEGKNDSTALGEIVLNWKGVDAEFSRDNLNSLLENYPTAAVEFFNAFRSELMEARRKN